jgi:RND superfamily putative drug exporter
MKIEGTESQKVLDQLTKEMPEASGGQASIVFVAPEGETLATPKATAAIVQGVKDVYGLQYVIDPAQATADTTSASQKSGATASDGDSGDDQSSAAATTPFGPLLVDGSAVPGVLISQDGSVALFQFTFTEQIQLLPEGATDAVIAAVDKAVSSTKVTALPSESLRAIDPPMGLNEVIGLVIAAIVLVLTLGSLTAAGLPIVTALVGVGIGVGGAYALSSVINLNSIAPTLALMIGLAVGIDYALFIVNRQRRLILDLGLSARDATGRAVGTSGSAVFFAGLTVIIALCGLALIRMGFVTTMALVAAVTVLVAVLIALTLLPALLGLLNERICSTKAREKHRARREREHRGFAHRWASGVVRHRWLAIVAVVVVLGAVATPMLDMDLGIPSGATANKDSDSRRSYEAISAGFGEGFNGPLMVVVQPTAASGVITQETLAGVMQELQAVDDVSMVLPVSVNETGRTAILNVIPKTGPSNAETKDLVEALRAPDSAIANAYDVSLGVTGLTAITIDISDKLAGVFPMYVAIVIALSLVILLLVFRSIAVPLKATLGFLLSILATFGITTAVFQWGWLKELIGFDTGGPLLSFLPIMITGILFGLAMDYEVFLVSSMREAHVHGTRGTASVIHGFDHTSRVVVAAAVIMISIFSGFVFGDEVMIKQIGFALAIGIFIDAFIIRMTFVPAVIAALGERTWWLPAWLERLLPNLDVEGDRLLAHLNREQTLREKEEPESVEQP